MILSAPCLLLLCFDYPLPHVRFVIDCTIGLVEGQQTKFYAEPVNVLAGRLGLPQWLVDLRHEATHSQVSTGRQAGGFDDAGDEWASCVDANLGSTEWMVQ